MGDRNGREMKGSKELSEYFIHTCEVVNINTFLKKSSTNGMLERITAWLHGGALTLSVFICMFLLGPF